MLSNAPRISAAQINYKLILPNILHYATYCMLYTWPITVVTIPTIINRILKAYQKKILRMITNFSEIPSIYFPQLGLTL